MPELPEVETTVRGITRLTKGRRITALWTDYLSSFHTGKDNIKNPLFLKRFEKAVVGTTIIGARRRAKNVLIDLSNGKTILIHMKMTGHFLYGRYRHAKAAEKGPRVTTWIAETDERAAFHDPFNQFIRFVFSFDNGKQLAFSDMRRFAKITLFDSNTEPADLADLGPEPLDKSFTYTDFEKRLATRPNGKIKQVLMDQSVIAGVGNIYSDEILWVCDVHPLSVVRKIPQENLKKMYKAMRSILERSLRLGGDSMSDFRNLEGEKGGFHTYHNAYFQHGKPCKKCGAIIKKIRIGQRSAHFCPTHQHLYK